jgi:hypothetical protein
MTGNSTTDMAERWQRFRSAARSRGRKTCIQTFVFRRSMLTPLRLGQLDPPEGLSADQAIEAVVQCIAFSREMSEVPLCACCPNEIPARQSGTLLLFSLIGRWDLATGSWACAECALLSNRDLVTKLNTFLHNGKPPSDLQFVVPAVMGPHGPH